MRQSVIRQMEEARGIKEQRDELLAALKRLSAVYTDIWVKMSDSEMEACRAAWGQADAAIAKAEGR